mmetsp:Transcript_14332/g.24397  ORF Transcript_14332/g.24397 Transcript_14332/m.24397 type:complete len:139 (+) Transcript_14332:1-417(+)
MPIMNGYEACSKLRSLYTDSCQLFKVEKNEELQRSKSHKAISSLKNFQIELIPARKGSNQNLQSQQIKDIPLLIAYSALIDESVVRSAVRSGFDVIIEAPLSVEKIKSLIIDRIIDSSPQRQEESKIEEADSSEDEQD